MANALNPWNWFRNEEESRNGMQPRERSVPAPLSPFAPLSSFYQDMDRMFEQAFRNFGMPMLSMSSMPGMMFVPSVDIAAGDDEYRITAEVPGMDERDVKLEIDGDRLVIRGEKRMESRGEKADYQRKECSYGSFQRTLSLPQDADPEDIQADFRNGVLTISVARLRSRKPQARQIEIQAGRQQGRNDNREMRPERERAEQEKPKKVA